MEEILNKAEIKGKIFIDNYGQKHIVEKILGEGGQGMVCATDTPNYVIKFVTDSTGNLISKDKNPNSYKYNIALFKSIHTLPIDKKAHIAVPVTYLNDYAGYIMRLMDLMTPFSVLSGNMESYPETGGHRYRLETLSRVASQLSYIHSRGMVYCDISPNNIFITKNIKSENQNVWFIDTDNLFIPSAKRVGKLVYTERYAAPELLKGGKDVFCTQNSDLYSFAIMAFESLSVIHPFDGDGIGKKQESLGNWDDDDWDKTGNSETSDNEVVENPVYSGKYSWVDDPDDDSNRTTNGFPRQLFLTDKLKKLFNQTFHYGKDNPELRPTSYLWERAFAEAADITLECGECKMSHVVNDVNNNKCPWCGEKLNEKVVLKDENGKLVFIREIVFENDNESDKKRKCNVINVPERIFIAFDSYYNDIPFISIEAATVVTEGKESKDGKWEIRINKTDDSFFSTHVKLKVLKDKEEKEVAGSIIFNCDYGEDIKIVTKYDNYDEKVFSFSIIK